VPRTHEQIAAEAFKLRPRTAQISVWLDDSGSLHAVAPDHANGGVVPIEHPWLTTPEAVASFKKIWAALPAEGSLVEQTKQRWVAVLAEQTKQRERAVRSFDCPLTESSCTDAGCSCARCVRQEREDNAFRYHQQEKARACDAIAVNCPSLHPMRDLAELVRDGSNVRFIVWFRSGEGAKVFEHRENARAYAAKAAGAEQAHIYRVELSPDMNPAEMTRAALAALRMGEGHFVEAISSQWLGREDNAFRRHQEGKARAARGGSQQSKAASAALARAIASVKL
jgi:hypothetical protein